MGSKAGQLPAAVAPPPPPPPPAPQNFFSDPAAVTALLTAFAAGFGRPVVPTPPATSTAVDHSDLDAKLTFPTINSWLASILDVQPNLTKYAAELELNGLTHLNHIDNPDLTIQSLREMTGMNFVEASAFLRMGKKTCQEFREVSK